MKCPYCAEEIKDDAIKCRYCGEWITKKNILKEAVGILGDIKDNFSKIKQERLRRKLHFPTEGNPVFFPKGIIIKTDSINYENFEYTYDRVKSVGFWWHKEYVNYVPSGGDIELELIIEGLENKISISASTAWATESKKIMSVYSAFLFVKNMSFRYRYKRYFEFISKNCFFKYSDAEFHVDGTIRKGDSTYNIRNGRLLKSPFILTLEIDPGKLGGLYGRKEIVFSTKWDSDVFYELIKYLYGIVWKD